MANIALYRKYRPRSFAEVIGQEHVTEPLIAALRNGKLNHAYLFSGPRGCGKTSSARILARSVNCEKGPTPEPCGVCDSCRALAPDGPGSIDVIEIDAASHGGVDDARELREKAFFAPVNSRYKVYVIDEAHMVSSAGFNALLKLVEEPPEYVMFVFATTEPDKVLGTIKSRTHHYPFRLVPPATLREHLESVCAKEGVTVEPAVFPLVVKAGGGSVRDSMSVLDQLLAGADENGVTYQRAVGLLGVTDAGLIDAAVDALGGADGAGLFSTVDRVVDAGHDPRRFASDLLERLRDLIVLNQVPDAMTKGLLDVPPDDQSTLTAQALRLGPATLARMADILHEGLTDMRGATSPRLTLEILCARMLLPGDESTADLLHRMEALEQRLAAGVPAPPVAAAAPPAAPPTRVPEPVRAPEPPAAAVPAQAAEPPSRPEPAPAPPAPPVPAAPEPSPVAPPPPVETGVAAPASGGGGGIADVERAWPQIVEHTKRRRVVWSLLQNAAPFGLDGDTLVLKARNGGIAGRFNDDTVVGVVQEALQAVVGKRWRIRCEANPTPVGSGPAKPAAAAPPAPPAPRATPSGGNDWPDVVRPAGHSEPAPSRPEPPSPPPAPRAAVLPAESAPRASATAVVERPPAVPDDLPDGPTDFSPDDPVPETMRSGFEGFAPGDEPLDEPLRADAPAPASLEDKAVELIVEHLGAEKLS